MFSRNKFIYKLNQIKSEQILLFPHLGLGDLIITNGLVNYISKELGKHIYLPVKDNYFEQISYFYSENKNVTLFEIKNETREENILSFGKQNNLQILKIGYEKVKKEPFNTYFYKQLKIPYSSTYEYFSIPVNKQKNKELENHLKDYYKITEENINLVHNESSYQKYDLNISNNFECIYVNKDSDIFNNMFFYESLIKSASEIHCVNGSFFHLVERIDTNAKLFYHHLRKNNMHVSDKWEWIRY